MARTAFDIAKYLVAASARSNAPISNLKLQKLLYYAQAWHLALNGDPLFPESIQAWVHGPVVPSVFRAYKTYRWQPIEPQEPPTLPSDVKEHLDAILWAYGSLSAAQLEQLSHEEEPWKKARGSLDARAPSTAAISNAVMRDYFIQQVVNG